MLIYLHRHMARASCESEVSAARLEAQGWVRCSPAVHKALWQIANVTDRARLAREDARETAPLGRGPVYVVKERTMP